MEAIPFSGSHSFQLKLVFLAETIPFNGNYFIQWKAFLLVQSIPFSRNYSLQQKPLLFSGVRSFQSKLFLLVEAIPFSKSHYELRPKKWVFGSGGWTKNNTDYQQPQDVYFLEKYDELSELVAFGPKLRYFTDQNGAKGGPHKNDF